MEGLQGKGREISWVRMHCYYKNINSELRMKNGLFHDIKSTSILLVYVANMLSKLILVSNSYVCVNWGKLSDIENFSLRISYKNHQRTDRRTEIVQLDCAFRSAAKTPFTILIMILTWYQCAGISNSYSIDSIQNYRNVSFYNYHQRSFWVSDKSHAAWENCWYNLNYCIQLFWWINKRYLWQVWAVTDPIHSLPFHWNLQ